MSDLKMTVDKEKLETTMMREFDALREKVWQAYIDPKLVVQWWGADNFKTTIEPYEPHKGGKWKMIHEAEGQRHVFFGEFKEVVTPEKFTWTFNYESFPNSEIVETFHFEEVSETKTRIRIVSRYPSTEALKQMVESGMEEGANLTWTRLEEFLAK